MGMNTQVAILKKKLEEEAGVVFSKDEAGNRWTAEVYGEPLGEHKRTLSQVVWATADALGEDR